MAEWFRPLAFSAHNRSLYGFKRSSEHMSGMTNSAYLWTDSPQVSPVYAHVIITETSPYKSDPRFPPKI